MKKELPKLPRTGKQNNAIHLFCTQVAEELNGAGLDVQTFIRTGIDIPWTPELAKELLWRKVQKVITGKHSTTELDRYREIGPIWEVINRRLAVNGIHIPFPNKKDALESSLEMAPEKTLEEEVTELKQRDEKKKQFNFTPRKPKAIQIPARPIQQKSKPEEIPIWRRQTLAIEK